VALVVTDAASDTLNGRIARINPMADEATRQVKIYVEVANSGGRLVSGLYVSGVALTADVRDAISVPRSAVRTEGDQRASVVYLVAGGRIARRVVQLGVEDAASGRVQIVSGVAAGDTVVVGPVDDLSDGTRVQVAAAIADTSKAR
jgi:RND family efflux transporter MFP subunit